MMKALTVLQPWAWAIIHGPKRIENRTWRTNYRGPLAIHAGKGRAYAHLFGELIYPAQPDGPSFPLPEAIAFGAVIGTATLIGCVKREAVPDGFDLQFAEGPWCWLLANVRPCPEPILCTGRQMLWDWQG